MRLKLLGVNFLTFSCWHDEENYVPRVSIVAKRLSNTQEVNAIFNSTLSASFLKLFY